MQTVTSFPRQVKEIENIWIPLSDGVRLAARLWLPEDAEEKPVPAILEYLPYRKRDGTIVRDALTHPYFAGHGYAAIRVDMRGNGDSEGLLFDEYTKQEQDDALEVIDWLTRQKWCSGPVGMIGISWGGFNGLQVAARKPPALKAVVTLCSTDDRYQDDIHYKGGCVINEHMAWAATMFAYSSRPPDPAIVGDAWRKMWMERLESQPMLIVPWLEHPHRDAYWKHASVCEDFGAIEAACLVVGGWNDAYSNAIPRLMAGLRSSCKAIIGPWIHKYPHFSMVGPRIGFLQEALRWWDFWLKGEPTQVMRDPPYRVYVMDAIKPTDGPDEWPGRWIAEQVWNAGNTEIKQWYLNEDGIGGAAGPPTPLTVASPQDIGLDGGDYCIMFNGSGFPGNQVRDDAGSLTFDSPRLVTDMDIVGQPAVELDFSVDRPVAFVAIRLNDVWPTGEVTRITYQLQNLCQHRSREAPEALEPGRRYRMKIALDDVAWRIPEGHRLRVSISTAYWPLMWPAPEPVTLTVHGGTSRVHVPVRREIAGETAPVFRPAEAAAEAQRTEIEKPQASRKVWTDEATGETVIAERDDGGRYEIVPHGLVVHSATEKTYRIRPDDPLSARMETHWTEELCRGDWRTRIETHTRHEATGTHWIIWGLIEAFEGDARVFRREWNEKVERKLN
ncbi:MAG: CocE/NonD family hydrolase [Parvibaculaceae bacterium]